MRPPDAARAVTIEPLETRRLAAVDAGAFPEVEPNGRAVQPVWSAAEVGQAIALRGRVGRLDAKDYFAIAPSEPARLTVSLRDFAGPAATLQVELASGERIYRTRSAGSFNVQPGQTYYLLMTSPTGQRVRYHASITLSAPGVPEARVSALRAGGINMPEWFWNIEPGVEIAQRMRTFLSDADARNLHNLGLRHVRLPVDSGFFFDWHSPGVLKSTYLDELDAAINLLTRNGLSVIVVPIGEIQSRAVDPFSRDATLSFTRLFARHLARFDPDRVFIQLTGEPEGHPTVWQPMMDAMAAEVRAAAPEHTIVTGTPLRFAEGENDWGSVDALIRLRPVDDGNVVYSFHFYEPFIFTHQGAGWALPGYEYLRSVPYPADMVRADLVAGALSGVLRDTGFEYLADHVRFYGQDRFNLTDVQVRLGLVADWAARWGVSVIADEFGARADNGPTTTDRATWVHDVRRTLEGAGFGWTMWDYDADFGLYTSHTVGRTLRVEMARALGLSA